MFKGVGTALITPFTEDGVDYAGLRRLIASQLEGGIDALIILGTTGEPATMTNEERYEIIRFALKEAAGKIPVIVGTGCNNTAVAVEYSKQAEKLGADGLLVVTPYYNKATQQGLVEHYMAIANNVNIPIIAYNVPTRTGVNMLPETFGKIAEHRNIIAMKEASGDIVQITEMIIEAKGNAKVFSGNEGDILPVLAVGGEGVISVAGNIVPTYIKSLTDNFFQGNLAKAQEIQYSLSALIKALFSEVNPIPVKMAASILGFCEPRMRLPLTKMTDDKAKILEKELKKFL